mmetsp:Transcript_53390/g.64352  ORF Transcript_53390/g.64352 Transcript_53390/m.64352 type:complete len:187 (+) Transcript_53390:182-742(+)
MTLTLPDNPTFSVGTSATTTGAAAKVDMSLDDIIKSRREETKSAPNSNDRKKGPRRSVRQRNKGPNTAQTSLGRSVANRQARTNNRRGLRQSRRPTSRETTSEIKRKQKNDSKRPVKRTARPPPQKAVRAAVTAMNNAGFKVPQGMKVVINFEPKTPPPQPKRRNTSNGKGKSNSGPRNQSNKNKK